MMKKAMTGILFFVILCISLMGFAYASEVKSELDQTYYAVSGIKSAGGWDELKVRDLPNGRGTHIEFSNCTYVTYRTVGQKAYKLDGMHITIENFAGDGIGVAFSDFQSPDAYDRAFRFFAFNNTYGVSRLVKVYPDWNSIQSGINFKATEIASKIDIRMNKKDDLTWVYTFNGEEFEVSNQDVTRTIQDVDNVFVSFTPFGGAETIDNYHCDILAIHGGESTCANRLTSLQVQKIQDVMGTIDGIGKVESSAESLKKIQAARTAYTNLASELKSLVVNYNQLSYAESNYYVLNNKQTFREDSIKSSFYAISDLHIDTNGCTNLEFGSPQDRFDKAMRIMNKKKPDALLIAGDMTDWARFAIEENDENKAINQINKFKLSVLDNLDSQTKVFYTLGNHDSSQGSNVELFNSLLGDRFFEGDINKDTVDFKKNGFRHAVINGFDYLSVEWNYTDEHQDISLEAIEFMDRTLKEITSAPGYTNRPIFIVSHVPFASGLYGCAGETGAPNKDKLYKVVSQYPQIVYLAGHTHYPLNQQTAIYQRDFTMLATATTAYIDLPAESFLEEGGYKIGSCLMPKDLIQAQGVYVQIDCDYAIKVTRIDFLKNGEDIFESFIIPAPDMVNKTHLNYYGGNRKNLVDPPQFEPNAQLVAESIGEKDIRLKFDTAKNATVVDHYIIDIYKDSKLVKTYKSYTGTWRYTRYDQIPTEKQVDISGIEVAKPYSIQVMGVDEYGNVGNSLVKGIYEVGQDDARLAEEVDQLILAIGDVITVQSKTAIDAVLAKYNMMNYDQKKLLVNEAKLKLAIQRYEDLYIGLEQYYNKVDIQNSVVGENYWLPQGWLKYENAPKGIRIAYENAVPNVRMGLKKFNLDGLHLTFDQLNKTSGANNPSIGIIIGGEPHSQFTEKSDGGFLLFLDTNEGKLEALNGFKMILKGDELKYANLKDKEWDLKFTKQASGDFLVELNGLQGVLEKSFFNGDYNIVNTDQTYISLACWVLDCNFSYRLLSAHDKTSPCYSHDHDKISFAELADIENVVDMISEIGTVSLHSKTKIENAERIYMTINRKTMVKNAQVLLEARAQYDKLVKDSEKPVPQPEPSKPKGCSASTFNDLNNGLMMGLLVIGILLTYRVLRHKRYRV